MSPAPVERPHIASHIIGYSRTSSTNLNTSMANLFRSPEDQSADALSSEIQHFTSTILPVSSAPTAQNMSIPPEGRRQQESEDDEDSEGGYDDMPELVPVSVSSWYEDEDDLPDHTWVHTDPTPHHIFSTARSATIVNPPYSDSVQTPAQPANNTRATLADRIRNISTEYVAPWLANLEALQNRYLRDLPARRSDPSYTQDRQRALAELNRALAETEALTSRINLLANELQSSISSSWSARQGVDSPCVYVGQVPGLQRRKIIRSGETADEVEDYDRLLREGKVDANGCEQIKRVLVEADR